MLKNPIPKIIRYGYIIVCTALLIAPQAWANIKNKEQQLGHIDKQVTQLQQTIVQSKKNQKQLDSELRQQELHLAKLFIQQKQTTAKHQQHQRQLKNLEQTSQKLQKQLTAQQAQVAQLLLTQYKLGGEHAYLKLLLNLEQPQQLNRFLRYYRDIQHLYAQTLAQLKQNLNALATNQQAVAQETTRIAALAVKQYQQQTELQVQQQQRQTLLRQLTKRLQNDEQRLTQLKTDKAQLQKIIYQLQQQQATSIKQPFVQMRGKLPWPIRGNTLHAYGAPIGRSQLRYTGMLLNGKLGQSVQAIHTGRVIFAGWLRGFGLLLIIEHGKNYMSLYAHNQALAKKPGDSIQAGETVAYVGQSGGQFPIGLYFELRHNGKPINPREWLG